MSLSLCWKPEKESSGTLSFQLRNALQKRFDFGGGGRVFSAEDEQYLIALADQEVEGAQELLTLVKRHGRVRLWLES